MALFKKKEKNPSTELVEEFTRGKRYHRLELVGEGGIAHVSSVFDSWLNRVIAQKELKEGSYANPDLMRSFINEARLTSFLDHPGVIAVYDTFLAESDKLCYTMKLFDGRSLAAILLKNTNPGQNPSTGIGAGYLELFTKVCETLAYVHDRGVLHLDLKPDNIMVGRYGEIAIMDWGNACLYDTKQYHEYLHRFGISPEKTATVPEREGMILGTPRYMSPEQTRAPRHQLLPATDIFSTGIIFYEMLTGRQPFLADDMQKLVQEIRTLEPPPMHTLNPEIPRRLSAICTKMLAKEQSERYKNFHEVLEDIGDFKNSGLAFATMAYEPGQVIFREGDPGDYAFIILSGSVAITKMSGSEDTTIAALYRDEVVGELAIFSNQPRTASAIAQESTIIRIMNRETIEKELEKLSPWVGGMVTGLAKRFIDINDKLVQATAKKRKQAVKQSPGEQL